MLCVCVCKSGIKSRVFFKTGDIFRGTPEVFTNGENYMFMNVQDYNKTVNFYFNNKLVTEIGPYVRSPSSTE